MPINIIDCTNLTEKETGIRLENLCADDWEMPSQIKTLEKWLLQKGVNLPVGSYVADIGFSPREGALGGGAILTTASMKIMVDIGMELYLSEYPNF